MVDLTEYNTFNLSVFANNLFEVKAITDLSNLSLEHEPYIILGSGSDVLFIDDFLGTVLCNKIKSIEVVKDCGDFVLVKAGGGVLLDDLIVYLLKHGYSGLENLSLIPGTVGAAPIQNVGAYGVEIGELIVEVEVYDLDTHRHLKLTQEQCRFAYRSSLFKERKDLAYFITHVVFKVSKQFKPCLSYSGLQSLTFNNAYDLRNHVITLRNEKLPDPKHIGNAGSFFKNPIVDEATLNQLKRQFDNIPYFDVGNNQFKLAAGWLIEKANCKGIKHGQVGTWGKQALVIVNLGGAKPHEIVAMAKYICAEVFSRFNIHLIPEVRLFGKHGEIEWEQI